MRLRTANRGAAQRGTEEQREEPAQAHVAMSNVARRRGRADDNATAEMVSPETHPTPPTHLAATLST